jgi:formamidopyrimidine-DNA glycosylase
MPELPEAETIKRELQEAVQGQKIKEVIIHKPRVIKMPAAKKFAEEITGAVIKGVLRKGKAVILSLSSGKDLVVQLGMTGQLIYPGNAEQSRVSFILSGGKILDFNDQRMFGGLSLMDCHQELEYIKNLGPEPFSLQAADFKERLAGRKTKIKVLLMDQQFISGVGNIYANEVLFRSRIHPERPASNLSDKEKEKLLIEIKDTLNEAIRYKGSSVDNYVQLSGKKGGYVPHHKVYDRDKEPCLRCKSVIKKMVLGGRGTYYCPKCEAKG